MREHGRRKPPPYLTGQCPTGKRTYATKRMAKTALKKARRGGSDRRERRASVVRCYECPMCGGYHLTSHADAARPPASD